MGFGDFKGTLEDVGQEHGDKVEQGVDRAGDAAKQEFGHEQQVDQAVQKGKVFVAGDQEEPPPAGQ
ncbi:antitoxin [Saccharopolyspora aridisoli]|uniref:Antitoxin n=1 Tax=Saccharopolyspora aridisoli TaxID=2530385 RepID=A0A4R4UZ73_9PSEU|nr:antitoxin [Saccharopolyspora aridisoli]TDC92129.1 antitoxin [Saccharopolyspora aridisoli]